MKLSSTGTKTWAKVYGLSTSNIEYPDDLLVTAEGGFWLSGRTYQDTNWTNGAALMLKIDKNGALVWQKKFDLVTQASNTDSLRIVLPTSDAGLLFVGEKSDSVSGPTEVIVLKTDYQAAIPNCTTYLTTPKTSSGNMTISIIGQTVTSEDFAVNATPLSVTGNLDPTVYTINNVCQ